MSKQFHIFRSAFAGVSLSRGAAVEAQQRQAQRQQAVRRARLGRGHYEAVVKELVAAIRLAFEAGATATLFGLEGPLRHAIRSDFCMQGWAWNEADQMARDMLAEAFREVRAVRPSWDEGQLEWAIAARTLIERTQCVRCHKPLPEGHYKFCSSLCAGNHSHFWIRRKGAEEDRAVRLAIRTI